MPGRSVDFKCVPRSWPWFGVPARGLLGVVAGFAETAGVTKARRAAVLPCDDVVVVANRRIAVRRAAGVIACLDETAETGGDYAVSGKPRRFAVTLEQGAVGHDELDFSPRDPARCPGDAFYQVISHDLSAGTVVSGRTQRVGLPGERCVDGHAGGDR